MSAHHFTEGEKVKPGIELMHRVNSGEPAALNGRVVVVGGGNVACDVARTAVRCGLCTTRCKFDAIHLNRVYNAWGVPYEKLVGHVLKENVKKAGRVLTGKRV